MKMLRRVVSVSAAVTLSAGVLFSASYAEGSWLEGSAANHTQSTEAFAATGEGNPVQETESVFINKLAGNSAEEAPGQSSILLQEASLEGPPAAEAGHPLPYRTTVRCKGYG